MPNARPTNDTNPAPAVSFDTDDDLLQHFRAATLPADAMTHTLHVRLAWLYVQRWPLLTALGHMRDDTRRFTEVNGASGKYHETVTWAWMLMVNERVQRERQITGVDPSWPTFAARHPDLLTSAPPVLQQFYTPETLASDVARATFVWPDRTPLTPA